MASNVSTQAVRRLASLQTSRSAFKGNAAPTCLQVCRPYSTETTQTPPLLAKLKADLKTAMRAKDTARLSVLRSVLAATTNAAKTSAPIQTDVQLVQLLRKTARGNQEAAQEARAAGREDLIEKEETQIKIIDGYIAESGLQTLGKEEMQALVEKTISEAKSEGVDEKRLSGEVMKRLMMKGGPLEGKEVDRNELAQIAKELTK
ncbi:Altered inheritance of mitochondria protein 41, mitochondrial [Cytospora mali]|uniref:Altered inheritance of mitochondria protein 41 n=1 Tax=Cytospora mali TaxID=578113 RepID=A0A194UQE6_CYTMA|nr:Altered inheritance of mitochondria protein 41, mitochondrial [Valsa mali var. pyri (nom. inval.)]